VVLGGETLADTNAATALDETGLPTRYYVPRADVRFDVLVPTDTRTTCSYKGGAEYWSARIGGGEVRDVAWSYPSPIPARADIAGLVCFFHERVDEITIDGTRIERTLTRWSTGAVA
jgi:uncharacterized protein (DUF427 family)